MAATFFDRLKTGLAKTRQAFRRLLVAADTSELEELLLSMDVGAKATGLLLDRVVRAGGDRRAALETEITRLLTSAPLTHTPGTTPLVIMLVGVNGSGKTTTVGKLCRHYEREGRRVVVAAADTYRDAAAEQLGIWAGRAGVEIVSSAQGQDAAAVAFDAVQKALSRNLDIVLLDTAGRLHTRKDLMDEAVKIQRVCGKLRPGAPDEVWLVVDATVGQNGLRQAQAFHERLGLTGIIVTKLDGTAKGGILLPITMELNVPIRFVGTGETIDDLQQFEPAAFARALFEE
jgi:fused signal recognition particle receptor